jgi:hypothetical protein
MARLTKKFVPHHRGGHWAHFIHRDDMRPKRPVRRAYRSHALAVPVTTLPVDCVGPNPSPGNGCQWPMDGNDTYGDCGEAMACHTAGILTYRQGKGSEFLPSSQALLQQYFAESGGDNGMDEDMERDIWLNKGIAGNSAIKALDVLDIDPSDKLLCNYCIDQFYATNLAWSVPDAFIQGFTDGSSWLQPMTPDPNNGHYTTLTNIDAQNNNKLLTWGGSCTVSQAFIASVQPSLFVVFSLLQFDPATGYDSHGRHVTTQIAVWNAIGGNVNPSAANAFPPPTANPPVNPPPINPSPPGPSPDTFSVIIPGYTIPGQTISFAGPLGHAYTGQTQPYDVPAQTVAGTIANAKGK